MMVDENVQTTASKRSIGKWNIWVDIYQAYPLSDYLGNLTITIALVAKRCTTTDKSKAMIHPRHDSEKGSDYTPKQFNLTLK